MNAEPILRARFAQPFAPFILRTVHGTEYRVDQPEWVAIAPMGRTVAVFSTVANAFELVDTRQIQSLRADDPHI